MPSFGGVLHLHAGGVDRYVPHWSGIMVPGSDNNG